MTNLPVAQSNLQKEITGLTERLKPASEDNVSDAIGSLLAAGFSLPSTLSPDKAPAVYTFALGGVSATALKRTVTKIIRGEFETHRMYVPTPPELAVMARSEDRPMVADLERAKAILKAKSQPINRDAYTKGFKDIRVTHRLRSEELSRQGFVFFVECVGHEAFRAMGKRCELPVGATHLWAIDQVWAPAPFKYPSKGSTTPKQDRSAA